MKRITLVMRLSIAVAAILLASNGLADVVTVDPTKREHPISQTLWGLFFEDIGMAVEGTLHAEMVRNGSFEPGEGTRHWSAFGTRANISLDDSKPISEKNRWSMLATLRYGGGIRNDGYWGMYAERGESFVLSLMLRGDVDGEIKVSLEGENEVRYAGGTIGGITRDWKRHVVKLRSDTYTTPMPDARLVLRAPPGSYFYVDCVSLMPENTFKGHGCRRDVAAMLAAMRPKFLRFPGGCWVEGYPSLDRAYRWKQTIGDRWERKPQWNLEWGYYSTHVIGYHEYLQLAEDLDALPLFCINAGLSCQQRHKYEAAPMDKMGEWVQDALDAIAYATGPTNSAWGARRAAAGHPAPFKMPWIEIGNENFGPDYDTRYALFHDAIRKAYPDVKIIANEHERGRLHPKNRTLDIVDEHYYKGQDWFNLNYTRYDGYPRDGYHVFVGEFAAKRGRGNLLNAVSEAVFMIGLERNSDIVDMASYAPLLSNANAPTSAPIAIYADSYRCYGTPSYYVQQMFGANLGQTLVACEVDAAPCVTDYDGTPVTRQAIFANASLDGSDLVIKIANYAKESRRVTLDVRNGSYEETALLTLLTAANPYAGNSLENPCAVAPRTARVSVRDPLDIPAHSFQVLRLTPAR